MISSLACLLAVFVSQPVPEDSEKVLVPVYEHRPVYGIIGRHDAKIQMSAKVQVFQSTEVYVAYSQLLMWDVYKQSIPIRDTNYNPEIFYRYTFGTQRAQWVDFGAYEHESNGRDGVESRAWDRSYLRYHGRFDIGESLHFFWNAKAWYPWRMDVASPDINHYRGYWELDLTLKDLLHAIFAKDEINFRTYPGGRYGSNPLAGGQEVSLRGKIYAKNFLPYFVVQMFHGHGENLLDYKRNTFEVRGGLGY